MTMGKIDYAAAAVSWRDVLPVHPAAELLPPPPAEELRELGEDIKRHGQRIPVSIQNGKLLDGRTRLDAMELAGLPVVQDGALNPLVVHVQTGSLRVRAECQHSPPSFNSRTETRSGCRAAKSAAGKIQSSDRKAC
jgi:hypothetical protein